MQTLVEDICKYVGQTVTIFTTSGGLSGSGFTGVLLSVDYNSLSLLCDIGSAPTCPVSSSCINSQRENYGSSCSNNYSNSCSKGNPLGSIAVIPTAAIACFTHNAI
jgi:hypothetical protein